MLIAVFQKDSQKYYKWGVFDKEGEALEFVRYILHSAIQSAIPSFIVAVSTPSGITKYGLIEYEQMANK